MGEEAPALIEMSRRPVISAPRNATREQPALESEWRQSVLRYLEARYQRLLQDDQARNAARKAQQRSEAELRLREEELRLREEERIFGEQKSQMKRIVGDLLQMCYERRRRQEEAASHRRRRPKKQSEEENQPEETRKEPRHSMETPSTQPLVPKRSGRIRQQAVLAGDPCRLVAALPRPALLEGGGPQTPPLELRPTESAST